MRFAVGAAVVAVAVAIGGCGGGGNSNIRPEPPDRPRPPPTKQCPDGSVIPYAEPCPSTQDQGTGPLPGIGRIPRSAIRASNDELAKQWVILEMTSTYGAQNGHADAMRAISCEAFLGSCEGGEPEPASPAPGIHRYTSDPFTLIDGDADFAYDCASPSFREAVDSCDRFDRYDIPDDHPTRNGRTQLELLFTEIIPKTVKIVSASTAVGLSAYEGLNGKFIRNPGSPPVEYEKTSFAIIQATGNHPDENGVGHLNDCHLRDCVADPEVAAALRDGRLLFVAGYAVVDGGYVVDPSSVSCEGAEEYCLHAPFTFVLEDGERVSGTSAATPQVAAALGTVLALFPDTSRQNLIQLARVCAVSEPRLAGLGRADFTCMTVMDGSGEWRVVGVDDVISPMAMQSLRFPGQASLSGTFENANGGDITLGLTSLGLFQFTPGVPVITNESVTGFFPMMVGDERNPTLGIGYASDRGWFSRLSYGQRDTFFGLGETYGYAGGTAIDADVGHRNLFARVSWQSARRSRLIDGAQGVAFGISAQRDVYRVGNFGVSLSGSMSRFAGGSADTAFGKVVIGESRWNREVAATARYASSDASTVEVGTEYRQFGAADGLGVTVNYSLRF